MSLYFGKIHLCPRFSFLADDPLGCIVFKRWSFLVMPSILGGVLHPPATKHPHSQLLHSLDGIQATFPFFPSKSKNGLQKVEEIWSRVDFHIAVFFYVAFGYMASEWPFSSCQYKTCFTVIEILLSCSVSIFTRTFAFVLGSTHMFYIKIWSTLWQNLHYV